MAALRVFVETFGRFWDADRPAMRRLRALAALDPEVGSVISARDSRRQMGLGALAGRLAERPGATSRAEPGDVARVLYALTSFETFDALADPGTALTDGTVVVVVRLVEAVVGQE